MNHYKRLRAVGRQYESLLQIENRDTIRQFLGGFPNQTVKSFGLKRRTSCNPTFDHWWDIGIRRKRRVQQARQRRLVVRCRIFTHRGINSRHELVHQSRRACDCAAAENFQIFQKLILIGRGRLHPRYVELRFVTNAPTLARRDYFVLVRILGQPRGWIGLKNYIAHVRPDDVAIFVSVITEKLQEGFETTFDNEGRVRRIRERDDFESAIAETIGNERSKPVGKDNLVARES